MTSSFFPEEGNLLSTASLQNNIGALMLLMGSVEEAAERFHLAIESVGCDEHVQLPSDMNDRFNTKASDSADLWTTCSPAPRQQRHRSASYDGLVWFYQRLCRQVLGPLSGHSLVKPDFSTMASRSTSTSTTLFNSNTHTSVKRSTSSSLHQTHTVIYNPPLGFEYITEPIMVGPQAYDGRIAAYLNLASMTLMYRRLFKKTHPTLHRSEIQDSDDSTSHEQATLQLLQRAKLYSCNDHHDSLVDYNESEFITLSLAIIIHLNIGVLLFSLGKIKDAFLEFQAVMECWGDTAYNQDTLRQHMGTLVYEYLRITTICNLTRTFIRVNQMHRAMELCEELIHTPLPPSTSSMNQSVSLGGSGGLFTSTRLPHRCKWMIQNLSKYYFQALIQHRQEHWTLALESINHFLSLSRVEYGHSHVYVATVLERKAAILFDQRNLHGAMLAYLASLRIYESYIKIGPDPQTQCNHDMFQVERARLLYAIGRTLHDREEYVDALSMYSKALEVQRDVVRNIANQHQNARVDVITTLCNVGRIHHLLGDLDKALRVNNEVVNLAIEMVTRTDDDSSSSPEPSSLPESHDFVRNRMISLGNLYVEAGRLEEAMTLFTRIARSQGLESMLSYRPEGSDIDTSAFAVKAAERLGKIGLQIPHAAAA